MTDATLTKESPAADTPRVAVAEAPILNKNTYCDGCGAATAIAQHIVSKGDLFLTLCTHHARAHQAKLQGGDWTVTPEVPAL